MAEKNKPEQQVSLSRNAVYAIIAIVAIVAFVGGIGIESQMSNSMVTVKADDCGTKVINYLNANVVPKGTQATLLGVNEQSNVYQIMTMYQGKQLAAYASTDCNFLFLTIVNMSITNPQAVVTTPTPKMTWAKMDVPLVNLWVMAFCPYGTQAEKAMAPVQELLGNKTNMQVRFITQVNGDTVDSIQSLHGPLEAKEDLRQAYIQKYYPTKFWSYLNEWDAKCYPLVQNQSALDACRATAMADAGLDATKVESASQGPDGINILKQDMSDAMNAGITGSPTLVIVGITYNGDRTPLGYEQAICNSFITVPKTCAVNLSTISNPAAGNCG